MLKPQFMQLSRTWLALFLALMTGLASAHQQKQSFTTLLFNDRTHNLEVSHRFLLHDAEHILSELFGEKSDLIQSQKSRDRFAAYIQQNFELQTAEKEQLPLSTVGNEVDGKYFWVYQEMPSPQLEHLRVRHGALQEIWPSQINYINLEKNGDVRSLRIDENQQWYVLDVPQ